MKGNRLLLATALSVMVAACLPGALHAQKRSEKNPRRAGQAQERAEVVGSSEQIALEELEEAGRAGDSRALFFLGMRHFEGEDELEKNPAKAAEYFRKSADAGFHPAHYSLGLLYLEGEGIEKDDDKAAQLFLEAADFGYAPAQAMLGALFSEGRGLEKDDTEAFKWYRRAAWQGDLQSQVTLGFLYANGIGTDVDYRRSAEMYRLASDEGYAPAQANLGQAYYEGKGVRQSFEAAREWYLKSAAQGDLWGLNAIAWLLATCEDAKIRDGGKAVEFARKAIDLKDGDARFEILDTLAAALARNGEFEEAVEVQKRALKLLEESVDLDAEERGVMSVDFGVRLGLYLREKAYVEPAPEPVESPKEEGDHSPKKGRVVASV